MRTRNSLLNMAVTFVGQMVNLILLFASRKVFTAHFPQEYLGVNGLFTNVLTVLSLAELGIGTAMIYGLYQPAAEQNYEKVCELMNLYRLLYRIVGGIVLAFGIGLVPFLPYLIKDSGAVSHITLIYFLYLFDTAAGYFLSYKQAVLTANQQTFWITGVTQAVRSLQIILQIAVIILFENFYVYIGIQMCTQLAANTVLSVVVDKKYPYLRKNRKSLPDAETRKKLYKHVSALSMHRLGGVLVSHTDNLIISAFIGLATVGIYSNYRMVLNSVRLMMSYVYGSFSAGIGNLAASSDSEKVYEIHGLLNFFMSLLYGYLALCLYILFNPFLLLFFGRDYVLQAPVVFLIVLDFYIHGMRQITLRFRDGMGLYWHDRYKPLAESALNLIISIALVGKYSIAGVVTGTIISSLLTNFWVEPLVFMKYGVRTDWKNRLLHYYFQYAGCCLVAAADGFLMAVICSHIPDTGYMLLFLKGILCTVVYALSVFLVFHKKPEWQSLLKRGREQLTKYKLTGICRFGNGKG